MKRLLTLFALTTLPMLGSLRAEAFQRLEKPNILVILTDDPGEQKDLAAAYPDKARQLQELWDRWNAGMQPPRWEDPRWNHGPNKKKWKQ